MKDLPEFKQEFVKFLIRSNVLTFGKFKTKSGRDTPYFLNLGNIRDGESINRLGEFYAHAIVHEIGIDFDNLYGPAYKGISLVVATSIALHRLYSKNVTFSFNRKEAKDHGEKGIIIGHQYQNGDRVVIVEDVITAGTSIYESVPLLNSLAEINLRAVVVSADRQERGNSDKSALEEISETFNITAFGIITIEEIIDYLYQREIDGIIYIDKHSIDKIQDYREKYGKS